jgi:hypothetical protein
MKANYNRQAGSAGRCGVAVEELNAGCGGLRSGGATTSPPSYIDICLQTLFGEKMAFVPTNGM